MEECVTLLFPALAAIVLVRLLLTPLKGLLKIAVHSSCGFLFLWLLNGVSSVTGVSFPINTITVLIAGTLGFPGIGLLALLAML